VWISDTEEILEQEFLKLSPSDEVTDSLDVMMTSFTELGHQVTLRRINNCVVRVRGKRVGSYRAVLIINEVVSQWEYHRSGWKKHVNHMNDLVQQKEYDGRRIE